MNAPEKFRTWRWEDEDEEEAEGKLSYASDQKMPNAGTFIIRKEDHSMGNLIRMQLLEDKSVRFAGYRMPHPLVFDTHVKVQTVDRNTTPVQAFNNALEDLKMEVGRLQEKFKTALSVFDEDNK